MRNIHVNDRTANKPKRYVTNYIKTTKYNAVTFLPLALLFQFKRFANIYFLVISILCAFPKISPFTPESAIVPFVFVILCSVFREGIEDWGRYKSDKETNSQKVLLIKDDGTTQQIYSWQIEVGDILFIPEETLFPADLILLESSAEGVGFIQTSSLDGEKNLKKRSQPKDFKLNQGQIDPSHPSNFATIKGTCECDDPNAELYEFKGNLKLENKSYALSANQLLLKGSILKNTQWIIGFVVYTGKQTKLMMNSKKGRFKLSKVERQMNKLVIFILFVQIGICLLIASIGTGELEENIKDKYLYITDTKGTTFRQTFFRYFLLLNTLIPISLIVSVECVKVIQAYFISNDAHIYSKERDRPAKVSSASLNEELGQVNYIFSDKTGTLTRNIMEFKLCQVGFELYGDKQLLKPDIPESNLERKVTRVNQKQGTQYAFNNKQLQEIIFSESLRDSEKLLQYKIFSKSKRTVLQFSNQQLLVVEFLKLLSTAHQCMPEKKVTGNQETIFYQGPSPDEVTLVEFAQQHGFEFCYGSDDSAKVRWQVPKRRSKEGEVVEWNEVRLVEYQVFRRMEFNSDRKRMSILLRDPDDGLYKLYCKGADSIIIERLDPSQLNKEMFDMTNEFLTKASVKGFRTLLMAMKVLEKSEVDVFMEKCTQAETNIQTRERELQKIFNEFEQDLVLVGGTCVEDRLQDNVQQTISDLQNAGIKIWMLTGDKLETAENIGYSCNLLNKNMEVIKCSTLEDVKKNFNYETSKINETKMKQQIQRGILVEAGALKHILEDDSFTIKCWFLKIAKTCEAVICCRVSPAQKAEVVKLIKDDDPETVTLAIGDGANDVSMILEAHIGVGLYGNEGMRAVQSSDYALGEFQFLWRLLLVHGRWSYLRNADLILYFFYKNIVFTLPQMFYSFINAYSGQTIYDGWYISFYNLFFTATPLMVKAIFDQDINPQLDGNQYKKYMPMLYYVGQRSQIFNAKNFLYWLILGITHAVIVFVIPLYIFQENLLNLYGDNNDLWSFSVSSFTSVIFIVTLKLMIQERYFTWINLFSIFVLSLAIYFIYVWGSNYTGFSDTYLSMVTIFTSAHYYLTVLLCVVLCYTFDMFIESYRFELFSEPADFMRKIINRKQNIADHEKELLSIFQYVKEEGVEIELKRANELEYIRSRKMKGHSVSDKLEETIKVEERAEKYIIKDKLEDQPKEKADQEIFKGITQKHHRQESQISQRSNKQQERKDTQKSDRNYRIDSQRSNLKNTQEILNGIHQRVESKSSSANNIQTKKESKSPQKNGFLSKNESNALHSRQESKMSNQLSKQSSSKPQKFVHPRKQRQSNQFKKQKSRQTNALQSDDSDDLENIEDDSSIVSGVGSEESYGRRKKAEILRTSAIKNEFL